MNKRWETTIDVSAFIMYLTNLMVSIAETMKWNETVTEIFSVLFYLSCVWYSVAFTVFLIKSRSIKHKISWFYKVAWIISLIITIAGIVEITVGSHN